MADVRCQALVPSPVTLREFIRVQVREEVARYNANPAPRFYGLVQPNRRRGDAARTALIIARSLCSIPE